MSLCGVAVGLALGPRARIACIRFMFFAFAFIILNMVASGSSGKSDVVDIYNAATDEWSIEYLSTPRAGISAVSLPHQGLLLFAGGVGALLFKWCISQWVTNLFVVAKASLFLRCLFRLTQMCIR